MTSQTAEQEVLKDRISAPPYVPADDRLSIRSRVRLVEKRREDAEESRLRQRQKTHFDKRHSMELPETEVRNQVPIKKENSKQFSEVSGPLQTTEIEVIKWVLKRIGCQDPGLKKVALGKLLRFCPRRFCPPNSSGGGSDGISLTL